MRRISWLVAIVVLIGLWSWSRSPHDGTPRVAVPSASSSTHAPPLARDSDPSPAAAQRDDTSRYPAFLPVEAHAVLAAIARGGPFPHRQDGGVFGNRERQLPSQPRGYYREYTVETPGSRDRGARRIITGGGSARQSPPREYFYSDDHYRSFRRFQLDAQPAGEATR